MSGRAERRVGPRRFPRGARDGVLVLGAVVLAVIAYTNAVPNGFVIDDQFQIVGNPWVEGPEHLGEIFGSGVWDFDGRRSSYYRPLMFVHYMALVALAGRTAWVFHLANVLLHVVVTALVFVVAGRAFERDGHRDRRAAAAAAALFAVHPIHTEVVDWVAAVPELGMTLFVLLTVWTYDRGRTRQPAWLALSGACLLAALLFKETGVAAVAIVAAWEWLVADPTTRSWRRIAGAATAFAAALAVYATLRVRALGAGVPTGEGVELTIAEHVLAAVTLAAMHVEKMVAPLGLNVWHVFEPPASWLARDALAALATLALACAVLAALTRRSRTVRFAGVVVVVPLLPTFHFAALNIGISGAFAERYLYLPSVGFVLIVTAALAALAERSARARVAAVAVAVALIAAYAAGTVVRNPVWHDSLTIWRDAAQKSPDSGVAQFNYGAALRYQGFTEEGDAAIRRAVELTPTLIDREVHKGRAYLERGRFKDAVLAFHLALHLDPGNADARFGLALAYETRGWMEAARSEYLRAIEARPGFAEAHNNVGVLLASEGRVDLALPHFEEAVRLRPDDPDYAANLRRAHGR